VALDHDGFKHGVFSLNARARRDRSCEGDRFICLIKLSVQNIHCYGDSLKFGIFHSNSHHSNRAAAKF
jgi:hypothetical protein